jgi:hypothetical protein
MRKITPPQIMTASCCVRGSEIRGTFSANEMVAKDKRPSVNYLLENVNDWEPERLTHSCNDLCFQTVLIGKSTSKVAYAASSISSNVRHFSNVIEHVAACEEKDSNQANSGPKVSVLNNG